MKSKRTFMFLFFIVAGVVTGSMLASVTSSSEFFGWLSYGKTIGVPMSAPFLVDLALLKFSFAIEMSINVAQIITVTLSMLLYRFIATKL